METRDIWIVKTHFFRVLDDNAEYDDDTRAVFDDLESAMLFAKHCAMNNGAVSIMTAEKEITEE